MRYAVIVIAHYGIRRARGLEFLNKFKSTIPKDVTELVIIDNNSDIAIQGATLRINGDNAGLTGAWELGVKHVIDQVDYIIVCNDDLTFPKDSLQTWIGEVDKYSDFLLHAMAGPLTNGVLTRDLETQYSVKSIDMQPFVSKCDLNGFCFGMSSNVFKKLKHQYGEFFDNSVKWGGNEEALAKRLKEIGVESYIIPRVWVNHDKQRGWKLNGLK